MKIFARMISVLLVIPLVGLSVLTPSSSATQPALYIELVSISSDPTNYPNTNRISFQMTINRIDNARFSDITRVWFCPAVNWNGSACAAGQVSVSAIPSATALTFSFVSSAITLPDGEYLITSVTFRNGTTELGATLSYPRSGPVLIGTTSTSIPTVNIATADFWIGEIPIPAVPENNEPENQAASADPVVGETQPEPTQPETDPNSIENNQPESNPETNPEAESGNQDGPTNLSEDETQNDDASEASPNSSNSTTPDSENQSESPQPTPTEQNPIVVDETNQSQNNSDTESLNPEATDQPSSETEQSQSNSSQSIEQNNSSLTPTNDQSESATLPERQSDNQPNPEPLALPTEAEKKTQPTVDQVQVQPQVTESISVVDNIVPESSTAESGINLNGPTHISSPFQKAYGAKVSRFTGAKMITRSIPAGAGKIRMLKSVNSGLTTIKIGSRTLYRMSLAGEDQFITISWKSNRKGTLRIIPYSPEQEIVIDALIINKKLIANPAFLMRK